MRALCGTVTSIVGRSLWAVGEVLVTEPSIRKQSGGRRSSPMGGGGSPRWWVEAAGTDTGGGNDLGGVELDRAMPGSAGGAAGGKRHRAVTDVLLDGELVDSRGAG